jgi:predicted transcriptional regulator
VNEAISNARQGPNRSIDDRPYRRDRATIEGMETTIQLPPDVQRELKALADRTGRSEAEIVLEAVEHFLASRRRPRLHSLGSVSDPDVTSENLDEWLAANWKPNWE